MTLRKAARKGIRTFLQTFTAAFSVSALGWAADVQRWADGSVSRFPSVSPLGKAAAAALVAGAAGLIAYGQNRGEEAAGVVLLDPAKAPDAAAPPPEPADELDAAATDETGPPVLPVGDEPE